MYATRCQKCSRWLIADESDQPCPRCGSLDRVVFQQSQDLAVDKTLVARTMARRHYQADAGLERIVRLTGTAEVEVNPREPIKLLEVNTNTVPTGVMPVGFGPAPASGIPYPTVIVEVTPDEFDKIRSREWTLPRGWILDEEIPRPEGGEGGE